MDMITKWVQRFPYLFDKTERKLAAKVNITGNLSSIFFVGYGLGGMCFPPLSGYIFTSRYTFISRIATKTVYLFDNM